MSDQPTPSIPRRHDLDALRAVAMLLGIALHSGLSFMEMPEGAWSVQDTRQSELFAWFFGAVHGFRMPLFFLLSGFFTAMLWRKRSLRSLLWHRFKRIFVPLLIGTFTIVPAVWVATFYATAGAASEKAEMSEQELAQSSIHLAARLGDLEAIEGHLESGVEVDQPGEGGMTPLMHAIVTDQLEAAELLLQRGADPDARLPDGAVALHLAALFGRAEGARLLLEAGSDHEAANHHGERPTDSARAPWLITAAIAGMLQVQVTEDSVETGRAEFAKVLTGHRFSLGEEVTPLTAEEVRAKDLRALRRIVMTMLTIVPVFLHLWFLWFLCWLVVGFALIAQLASGLPKIGIPKALVQTPLALLWLVPLTCWPQSMMGKMGAVFGPDTSVGLLPIAHILGYYAIFFGFGAIYFLSDDEEARLSKGWWLALPLALLVVFPAGFLLVHAETGSFAELIPNEMQRPLSVLSQAVYVWLMTFGAMGLFRWWLAGENRVMRYLSDSSYWLYLVHLPVVILVQYWVRDIELPALVKFVIVNLVVTAPLLLSYQYLVRYTPIGTMLNGKRERPQRHAIEAAAEPA